MTKEDVLNILKESDKFTVRYNSRTECLESIGLRNWSGKMVVGEHVEESVGKHIEHLLATIPELCDELNKLIAEEE